MIKQYKKKPVVIEAVQFDGANYEECYKFMYKEPKRKIIGERPGGLYTIIKYDSENKIEIETLEGTMTASVGDYIIKGVNGEFYPCKPDIFDKTYEEVKVK